MFRLQHAAFPVRAESISFGTQGGCRPDADYNCCPQVPPSLSLHSPQPERDVGSGATRKGQHIVDAHMSCLFHSPGRP